MECASLSNFPFDLSEQAAIELAIFLGEVQGEFVKKALIYFSLLSFLSLPSICISQDAAVKASMRGIYESFRELQPYIMSSESFHDPANRPALENAVNKLADSFHSIDSFDSKYKQQPGFEQNLKVIGEMLSDVRNSLKRDNSRWAYWRLKTISNNCLSCHSAFGIDINFYDSAEVQPTGGNFERGEFFLATRQFDKARDEFFKAALDPKPPHSPLDALRKWLIIYTRVDPNPAEAIKKLGEATSKVKLSHYERESVNEWTSSLKRWAAETPSSVSPMLKAENLLRQALAMNDALFARIETVELLRASALLHNVLSKPTIPAKERSRALYLLGLSYAKLPLFFINELPEIYLEQLIREFPATPDAQRGYSLLNDLTVLGYTGSMGTDLPDDVQLKLEELHNLAYGVGRIEDRA